MAGMNEQRYVRPTVAGWLTPTLLAPWISVYGAITAFVALGLDKSLFGKGVAWVGGMVAGSMWAFAFCTVLVLTDLLLLGVRVRTLPAGRRGWGTALLAPFAVLAIYMAAPPHQFYRAGPWAVIAAVVAPMIAVAFASRVAFGMKPPR
jgi:hypothetical protein